MMRGNLIMEIEAFKVIDDLPSGHGSSPPVEKQFINKADDAPPAFCV